MACREWRGPHNKAGYGTFRPVKGGPPVQVTRWIVEQIDGPLAPGEVVRHKCDNPPCFLYEHLERGTAKDNTRDMMERGRGNQLLAQCKRGHDYDESNTRVTPRGRWCRKCDCIRSAAYQARKREGL